MKRVKRRTFSGAICEQEVFTIRENQDIKAAEPRQPRFLSPGRREMNKISEEKRAKVLEALKDQHKSMKKIAQETGVGMSTVQKIKNEMLRKMGRSRRP